MKKPKPRTTTKDGIPVWCAHDALVDPSTLKPYPDNPNKHHPEQIAGLREVITLNGWRETITVSNRSGLVTKGNGRLAAALRGDPWKEVPIQRQDYESEQKEWEDVIADNAIAGRSRMDNAALRKVLTLRQLTGPATGLTPEQIAKLTANPETKPEVEFSEFIGEANNYVVLLFDTEIDWLRAMTHFEITTKYARRRNGKPWSKGVGRVINGAKYLKQLDENAKAE